MTIDRALELQARAWTLQAEGNLDDAFAACHEALLLTEQCEGSDSADVANLLNDLAEIECDRQKFQAALTYSERDRKSTRLNSSHSQISYAVFCLKKKKPCSTSRNSFCSTSRLPPSILIPPTGRTPISKPITTTARHPSISPHTTLRQIDRCPID